VSVPTDDAPGALAHRTAVTSAPSIPVDPAELRDHTIVCGLSPLGMRIVEQLYQAGAPVVVLDDNADRRLTTTLAHWGVPCVTGSPRQAGELVAVGAAHADAVVCVEESDLHALEAALVAHQTAPQARVVAQISNVAVARALTEVTGAGTVLDVADLAAPTIVQACLGEKDHELRFGETAFRVTEITCAEPGSLRTLFGDLVPIAVVPAGGTDIEVCPGRDFVVAPADVVTVLGTPVQLDTAGFPPHPPPVYNAPTRAGNPTVVIRSLWHQAQRGLRITLCSIVALLAVSTGVLRFTYHQISGRHLDVVESLYLTVVTLSTVGYGDFSFASQGTGLQIFAIVIIIIGAVLVATTVALLTNLLLSRSLADALGRRRMVAMSGHVVIVGLGAIGVRVLESLLARGMQAVVIERDENNRHAEQARSLGVAIRTGDATLPSVLEDAGAASASAVAVLTSNDLTNLEVGLATRDYLARAASDAPLVLRVFDRDLSRNIEHNFRFRAVRSTSALAAPWFVGAALGLSIISTFFVESQLFLVARLTVAESGGLAGLSMMELTARIRVIAISRAPEHRFLEHPPRRSTLFAPGDHAYLIGPEQELLAVLRRDATGTAQQ
jgi:Trk K+ transport system NAD-binding subunit